jgi:hydrogenase 3 maturation protease
MTGPLEQPLRQCLAGRVCLAGLGNVDLGDDGAGVVLAEKLIAENRNRESEKPTTCEEWSADILVRLERSGNTKADKNVRAPEKSERRTISDQKSKTRGVAVLVGGTMAERLVFQVYEAAFDQVIFMDAVECGAEPGAVVLLSSQEMTSRFPQVSTHKLSLGLLARMIEGNGKTKVWLLGVQPASLRPGQELSEPVQRTLEALAQWLGTFL